MKYKIQIPFAIIFWIMAFTDVFGIATHVPLLHFVAKPLLIPILLLLLYFSKNTVPHKKLIVTGLFFSWLGDIFLLFDTKNNLFFIFGLVCFLTTHIFYILYFLKISSSTVSLLKKQPLLVLLVLVYGAVLVWLLYPHLGDLKLAVIIYATVICTMLLCSLHIFLKVNTPANAFYLAGAAFFVLSDSLLAINKFYQPFSFAGVYIMLTYCAAQYFIVNGFIKQLPHD
ncbi:lysoplasmalogenase [Ferruginibacter sp.]